MKDKILLVEDDLSIQETVVEFLAKEGYETISAIDGEGAIWKFRNHSFDLIILDIMMPKLDGLEVINIIRRESDVPILVMSAKDSNEDKALGLRMGADDYVSKPFSFVEFSARVKACIRRSRMTGQRTLPNEEVLNIGNLKVGISNYSVSKNGKPISLTSREFALLKLFVTNPKRVFTKEQIYQMVWGEPYFGEENVINVHIRRLREKIEDNPSSPLWIKTLWGIGYRFEGEPS